LLILHFECILSFFVQMYLQRKPWFFFNLNFKCENQKHVITHRNNPFQLNKNSGDKTAQMGTHVYRMPFRYIHNRIYFQDSVHSQGYKKFHCNNIHILWNSWIHTFQGHMLKYKSISVDYSCHVLWTCIYSWKYLTLKKKMIFTSHFGLGE
jgi:hypothetical protein